MPVWIKEGLLAETRPDQMENFKNVDDRWVNVEWDPGRHYSVPWQWGSTGVLVDTSIAACNDIAVYEVFTKALSYPKDNKFYLPRVRSVVKRCLKDKEFRKDFLEEQENGDSYIRANACQILIEEKLVKSCKEGK